MHVRRFAWTAAAAVLLVGRLDAGAPGQTPPSLSVAWEKGGIVRLKEGGRAARVNLSQDIVGCLGQLYDPTTSERFGKGEGTSRVLDVTVNQGRRFVLLMALAAANCNVQGHCGAAGEPNVTLIWLEIAADLSVVKKQTFAVVDCRNDRGVEGAPDDWADRLNLVDGSLTVTFTEFRGGSADVTGTVTYSRQTADHGLSIVRPQVQDEIVDTAYVEQAMARGAIVWDAREAVDYAAEHIPGSVNFGWVGTIFRDPNREDLPSPADAEKIFGAAGVDPIGKEVIVYTRKGDPFAHYGLYAMRYYGSTRARVYHGGLDEWKAAGKPVTKAVTQLPPADVRLSAAAGVALSNKDMLERVRGGGAQIVDARTPREYSGDDVRAVRGGHVPGALNIPYEENWHDPQTAAKLARSEVQDRGGMALKDEPALRALYAKLDPNKETIVYCHSGVRASETATVLRSLGFRDVKVYEPSWLGYAGMLTAPAENEVFVNVGALTGRIATLENRVKELEEQLAKFTGPKR